MIKVIQLNGTDAQLYEMVAPLVMNPEIIRYNQNYPFKTGENFRWFVALSEEKVIGFIPLELRTGHWVINNYYVQPDVDKKGFKALLKAIDKYNKEKKKISAVVQIGHKEHFAQNGFKLAKEWKIYLKMEKTEKTKDEDRAT